MDEVQVKRVASTLYALRRAIQTLNQSWDSFEKPKIVEGCEHPRFFPYWDSFTDEHRKVVKFVYVKPLEDWPSCVTFLAKRLLGNGGSDDKDSCFVIKFVRRYERDAHAVMGKEGFAPKLLGFRQLREEDSGYKDLVLVTMEYVEGKALCDLYNDNALPAEVKQGVQDALQALNDAGYIFADLRRPNVMVRASDEKVQLIGFDWVCKTDGGMRYPFHLSPDIKRRSKAKDYDVITLDHQNRMLRCYEGLRSQGWLYLNVPINIWTCHSCSPTPLLYCTIVDAPTFIFMSDLMRQQPCPMTPSEKPRCSKS
ncbi:hypothetical protein PM082_011735 [Marasmius tenuissimus]|nr:hypothetical protein PM082_011735 [Marasmius tenuissimus]